MTMSALAVRLCQETGADFGVVSSTLGRLIRDGQVPSIKLPSDKNGRRECLTFLLGEKCGMRLLFSDWPEAREFIAKTYTDMHARIERDAQERDRRKLKRVASAIQRYLAVQLDGGN